MNNRTILFCLFAAATFFGCRKSKPIDIAIPQTERKMVVSSTVLNDHMIMVSAGYSLQSTANIENKDTTEALIGQMLIDSAIVTINEVGQAPVRLSKIAPLLYSAANVALEPGKTYALTVTDCRTGKVATATTTYLVNSRLIDASAKAAGNEHDSLVKVSISIGEASANDRYMVSYSTLAQLRHSSTIRGNSSKPDIAALMSFEPKRLQLLENSGAGQTEMNNTFTTKAAQTDTMVIQIAHIDDAYFKYLTAYKRVGYLINQLTGEPINLPTNIKTGYGYFALYQTKVFVLDIATGAPLNPQHGLEDLIRNWIDGHI